MYDKQKFAWPYDMHLSLKDALSSIWQKVTSNRVKIDLSKIKSKLRVASRRERGMVRIIQGLGIYIDIEYKVLNERAERRRWRGRRLR